MSSIQWKDIKSNIHIKLSLDRIHLQSYQVIIWYVEKANWIYLHSSFVSVLLSEFINFVYYILEYICINIIYFLASLFCQYMYL